MSIKKIIKFPAKSLRNVCKVVDFPLSEEVQQHIVDLRDTLSATSNGAAIASNQVIAEGWNLFVVSPRVVGLPQVAINPHWEPVGSEDNRVSEGCLSVPELWTERNVFSTVLLSYQDESGEQKQMQVQGLAAQVVQHECDHLSGKLIYDFIDRRSRTIILAKAIKNRKAGR